MNHYSLWVMEYAYVVNQPTSLFVYGAHNQGHRKMPYGYIVIKGPEGVATIDVGYNHNAYGEVLAEQLRRRELAAGASGAGGSRRHAGRRVARVHHARALRPHGRAGPIPERDVLHPGARADEVGLGDVARAALPLADAGHRPGGHHEGRRSRPAGPARVRRRRSRGRAARHRSARRAFDTHTWGCQYVTVRNDLSPNSQNAWVFAGDLVYAHENLRGTDPNDPQYVPGRAGHGQPVFAHHDRRGNDEARWRRLHARHSGPRRAAEGSVSRRESRRQACASPSSRSPTARRAACDDRSALQGKTALITGSTQGLGLAAAQADSTSGRLHGTVDQRPSSDEERVDAIRRRPAQPAEIEA